MMANVRHAFLLFHRWAGLLIAGFLIVAGLTGAVISWDHELDDLLNSDLTKAVTPGSRLPPLDLARRIEAQDQKARVTYVPLQSEPGDSLAVSVDARVDPSSREPYELGYNQVFFDPVTGQELGRREWGKPALTRENFVPFLYVLHYSLHLPTFWGIDRWGIWLMGAIREYTKTLAYYLRHLHVRGFQARYGRQFVGLFGLALLVSSITGLAIYGNFMRSMRFGTIRWGQGLRLVSADWHKVVGISALAFNLVIAVTGAWLGWSAEALRLAGTQPDGSLLPMLARAGRIVTPSDDAAMRVDVDAVLAVARRARPGFEPRSLNMTRDGRRQVVMFGAPRSDLYAASTNKVLVDKQTLAVTAAFDISEAGAGSKLYYLMEPLHFGTFGGTALKIAYGAFGLTAGVLSITGFLVYWKRRDAKDSNSSRLTASRSLVRWSMLAVWATVLTLVASLTVGPLYPSTIISVLTLLWPLWLVGRFIRTGWRGRRAPRGPGVIK